MNKILLGLIISLSFILLEGCASTPDYQSMSNCQGSDYPAYTQPTDNSESAMMNYQQIKRSMVTEAWHPIVTHVDCHPVADIGNSIRLPQGKHVLHLRFNPLAEIKAPSLFGIPQPLPFVLSKTVDSKWSKSAQNLEINVKAGEVYELGMMTLMGFDSSFWITLNKSVIAHTPNFEEEWAK